MLRHNIFACVRDTREGVRRPRFPNAARSGPYPPLGPSEGVDVKDGGGPPRRPGFATIGTVHTPVEVGSGHYPPLDLSEGEQRPPVSPPHI